MVDCTKVLELLSELRDGSLGEGEVVLVRKHLDGCDPCKGIFDDLDAIAKTARTLTIETLNCPDENIFWQRITVSGRIVH